MATITINKVRAYIPEMDVDDAVLSNFIIMVNEADTSLTALDSTEIKRDNAKILGVCHLASIMVDGGIESARSFTGDAFGYNNKRPYRFLDLLNKTPEGRAVVGILNSTASAPSRIHVI